MAAKNYNKTAIWEGKNTWQGILYSNVYLKLPENSGDNHKKDIVEEPSDTPQDSGLCL